ncbi:Hypothetical protein, putative [Bodo saltans]|uniref:Uncharacterized protein n=1 Tax=Bodo saltans TaxID=75058 RepID=A0A0S4JRM4_BODSA|nr:Hypothetical protein, putative [Bodo saltans]|eukprot:CUG93225.1 Hypothetical protein, putative [Bodo saltans]
MMVAASILVAVYAPNTTSNHNVDASQEKQHDRQLDEQRRLDEADATTAKSASSLPDDDRKTQKKQQQQQSRLSAEELTAAHADAVNNLVEALQKGAKVSLASLHVRPNDRVVLHDVVVTADSTDEAKKSAAVDAQTEALLDAAHPTYEHLSAAHAIEAGASVVELPAQLQFNERTMSPTLRKGIVKLASINSAVADVIKDPSAREYFVVLSLILSYGTRSKNQWGPWLATLPGSAAMEASSALFLTKEDAACLCPFDRRLLEEMTRRRDELVKLVNDMCLTPIDEDEGVTTDEANATGEKLSPERLAKELACRTTPGQLSWAFAVFLSRQINFHGLPSMFPLMELLPYAVNANVKPGAIHTNEKGQFVSVSLAAARAIKAGDELTFRTDVRHPSDVFLTQGYHDPRHFGPIGLMVPVAWSPAVQNITAAPPRKATDKDEEAYAAATAGYLQCGVRDATFTIRSDGGVHEDLWKCAELDRAYQAYETSVEEEIMLSTTSPTDDSAAPPVAVPEVSVEGFRAYLAKNNGIQSAEAVHKIAATEETRARVLELLQQQYLINDAAPEEGGAQPVCALTDSCIRRKMCRELMEHNNYLASIVEKFSAVNSG